MNVWDAVSDENKLPMPLKMIEFLCKYADKNKIDVNVLSNALNMKPWPHMIFGNGLEELLFAIQLTFDGTIIHIIPSCYYFQLSNVVNVYTSFETGWKIDVNNLEECFQNICGSKMLLFNNPNNPTGICYTPEEVKQIGLLCKKYDVLVLADEIYSNLVFDDSFVSIGVHTLTIRGSSFSKDVGCNGLGWLAFPNELKSFMEKVSFFTVSNYSSITVPIQYAFCDLLKYQLFGVQCKKVCHYYRKICLDVCNELHSKTKLRFVSTQSSWYLFLCFSEYSLNCTDVQLCQMLLDYVGIIALPGSTFRCNEPLCVRFSLSNVSHVRDGINRLISWLNCLLCDNEQLVNVTL